MEKSLKRECGTFFYGTCKMILLTLIFYVGLSGILGAIVYSGRLELSNLDLGLSAETLLSAVLVGAVGSSLLGRRAFYEALSAQSSFQCALFIAGALCFDAEMQWFNFLIRLVLAVIGCFFGSLLFKNTKKKKFKKNSSLRLKKR